MTDWQCTHRGTTDVKTLVADKTHRVETFFLDVTQAHVKEQWPQWVLRPGLSFVSPSTLILGGDLALRNVRLAGLNSSAMSLLGEHSQFQQQAWVPRPSIFCPHCWLPVQKDSKLVVLEISLNGLICSNLRPAQATYVERAQMRVRFLFKCRACAGSPCQQAPKLRLRQMPGKTWACS